MRPSTLSRISAAFLFALLAFSAARAQHIVARVPVGNEPRGVAVNFNTGNIYVANVIDGTVSVLHKNTAVATIPVDTLPFEVAVNSNTNRIYATGCNFQTGAGSMVVVIDGSTNKVITNITVNLSCGLGTQGIAVNPRTNRIYVSDYDDAQEIVIDGATNQILTSIDLSGRQPIGLAVNPRNNQIWVALDGPDGKIDLIDGLTNTVLDTVTIASVFLYDVAIDPVTERVFVSSYSSPSGVYVLDAVARQVITQIPFGEFATSIDADPFTNRVFVVDGHLNEVGVIDGGTNSLIATVPLHGSSPSGIAANFANKIVHVTEFDSAQVELMTEE